MPYRSPGAPKGAKSFLKGKPIRYYRPKGSAAVRTLIDEGFQAFNAARLGEACRIFGDKMLAKQHDTTIALTHRRRDDAGRARRLHHRADGARADRLRDQHRRQPVSRSALRAELHAAPRLAVRRRSRAVRRRRDSHLRRAVSGAGAARYRQLHSRLPRDERHGRPGVDRGAARGARQAPAEGASGLREVLGRGRRRRSSACRSTPRRPATARSA